MATVIAPLIRRIAARDAPAVWRHMSDPAVFAVALFRLMADPVVKEQFIVLKLIN